MESVTTVTERELEFPLSVKQAGAPPPLAELLPFYNGKLKSFSHFRLKGLRVSTKPAL